MKDFKNMTNKLRLKEKRMRIEKNAIRFDSKEKFSWHKFRFVQKKFYIKARDWIKDKKS